MVLIIADVRGSTRFSRTETRPDVTRAGLAYSESYKSCRTNHPWFLKRGFWHYASIRRALWMKHNEALTRLEETGRERTVSLTLSVLLPREHQSLTLQLGASRCLLPKQTPGLSLSMSPPNSWELPAEGKTICHVHICVWLLVHTLSQRLWVWCTFFSFFPQEADRAESTETNCALS